MKILLMHQAFVGPGESGGTRHYELSRHLATKGHSVVVIASKVNYLTGASMPGAAGEDAGVEIRRVGPALRIHAATMARLWAFLVFAWSSFIGAFRAERVDVVWATSPPIFQAFASWAFARIRRRPLIVELRDLWPDAAIGLGVLKSRLLVGAARIAERALYRAAASIVINSPGFAEHLIRCGIARQRITLIPNGVDLDDFDAGAASGGGFRKTLNLVEEFVVLYAGAHGPANDLGTLLEAADRLRRIPEIVFVLVGDGSMKSHLVARSEEMELPNVRFLPAQPKDTMGAILTDADICLGVVRDVPLFRIGYPNKVLDYMAAARATVLAMDGAIRDLLEESEAGLVVRPGDPDAIAAAIKRYHADPSLRIAHGRNARALIERQFSRAAQADQLEKVFLDAVGGSR